MHGRTASAAFDANDDVIRMRSDAGHLDMGGATGPRAGDRHGDWLAGKRGRRQRSHKQRLPRSPANCYPQRGPGFIREMSQNNHLGGNECVV